ncbi:MAG: tRNA(Ile2) 2-agmatinylcytidine synthetase, partial [Methanoregulaceae archaeon]|nr:tRNA(Ile2) 2-agmatinylcytidine synthetase [Methanoregulaceae archaeon]
IRMLRPGDEIVVAGSYKEGSINLEKTGVISVIPLMERRAPLCVSCGKRMTSAGKDKGYKCRTCRIRQQEPGLIPVVRSLRPGWYEVPPSARRHLARPLCRGQPDLSGYVIV